MTTKDNQKQLHSSSHFSSPFVESPFQPQTPTIVAINTMEFLPSPIPLIHSDLGLNRWRRWFSTFFLISYFYIYFLTCVTFFCSSGRRESYSSDLHCPVEVLKWAVTKNYAIFQGGMRPIKVIMLCVAVT